MLEKIFDIVKVTIERMVEIIMPVRIESNSEDTFVQAEPIEVYLATDPSGKQYNLVQTPDWSDLCILDTESRIALNLEHAISNGFKMGNEGPMSSCRNLEYDTEEGHIRENGIDFKFETFENGYSRESGFEYELEMIGNDGSHSREINSEREDVTLDKDGYARNFANNYMFEKLDQEGFFKETGSGYELESFDSNGYVKEGRSEYQNETIDSNGYIQETGFSYEVEKADRTGKTKEYSSAFESKTFGRNGLIFQRGFEYELETINKDGRVRENGSAYEIEIINEFEVEVTRGFNYDFEMENQLGNVNTSFSVYEIDAEQQDFEFNFSFTSNYGTESFSGYGSLFDFEDHGTYCIGECESISTDVFGREKESKYAFSSIDEFRNILNVECGSIEQNVLAETEQKFNYYASICSSSSIK